MDMSISPDLEQRIAAYAEAAGFSSVEAFLRAVLSGAGVVSAPPALNDAEFFRLFDELASDDDLPTLPEGFSRDDIYADHD